VRELSVPDSNERSGTKGLPDSPLAKTALLDGSADVFQEHSWVIGHLNLDLQDGKTSFGQDAVQRGVAFSAIVTFVQGVDDRHFVGTLL